MFLSVEQFKKEFLPEFVKGKEKLNALFFNHHRMPTYHFSFRENGTIETNNPALNIFLTNDKHFSSFESLMLSIKELATAAVTLDQEKYFSDNVNDEKNKQEREITTAKDNIPSNFLQDDNLLIVVYAGLYVFDKSIAFAGEVKNLNPKATVVILTCDCQLDEKKDKLASRKDIACSVVTEECGGYGVMVSLVKELIKIWPGDIQVK